MHNVDQKQICKWLINGNNDKLSVKLDNTQCGLSLANIESRNNIRIPRVMEADTSNCDADKETHKETNKNQFAKIIQ